MANNYEEALKKHYELKGKIEITPRAAVDSAEALAIAYTPESRLPASRSRRTSTRATS